MSSEAIKYFTKKYNQCVDTNGYTIIALNSLFDTSAVSSLPEIIDIDPEPFNEGTDTNESTETSETETEIKRAKFLLEQAKNFKEVKEQQPECIGQFGLL